MIEWIESRASVYVPKQDGNLLCSIIDPHQEARKWVDKLSNELKTYDVIFVLGLAGGFHISQLSQTFPNKEIIVIEPHKELEKELMSRRGPMGDNVSIISGLGVAEVKRNVFVRAGIKSLYRVISYPTSYRLNKNYFSEIESILLGRDGESVAYHLEGRSQLRSFFESINLVSEPTENVTILDIERAIRKRGQPLEREGMIFMALRELVK